MKSTLILLKCILLISLPNFAQNLLHADIHKGGITAGGFGLDPNFSGSGIIVVDIPPSANVKKAFLISGRHGQAPSLNVVFNTDTFLFDSTNAVSGTFQSLFGGNSNVHFVDVTNSVSSGLNSYSISIFTVQQVVQNRFNEFYLYVLYEDMTMPIISSALYLNNSDFGLGQYSIKNLNPIDTNLSVGLGFFTGYICDTTTLLDGEFVQVNGSMVGLLGGTDTYSDSCGGPFANFFHRNDSLVGIGDDTANTMFSGSDALADISTLIRNLDDTLNISYYPQDFGPPINNSNSIWSLSLSYSTPCDTFSTTITKDDTICHWQSLQLQATGGTQYSWYSLNGALDDTTIANPVASPNQTSTYICTITNDSGCVKTENVRITVKNCVGIEEDVLNGHLDIYPNPTSGIINIDSEKEIEQVIIINAVGKQVFFEEFRAKRFSFNPSLSSGLYFIQLRTDYQFTRQKIIIK